MSTAIDYLPANNQVISNSAISSEEDEVRRVEFEWGVAFERRDFATLDRIMADEYILTDPLGNVRGKAESLWPGSTSTQTCWQSETARGKRSVHTSWHSVQAPYDCEWACCFAVS